MIEEVLKAKAEGRKLDAATVHKTWLSHYAAKCQQRKAAAMKAVEVGLERLQRIAALTDSK
jgi:hypothetical protein